MKNILIIGGGEIGSAIKNTLAEGNQISLCDKDAAKCSGLPLAEAARVADFIFLCVPTFALRKAMEEIVPTANQNSFYTCLSKGMEAESHKLAYEVLSDFVGAEKYGILCGPMLAEEFGKGLGGGAVLASGQDVLAEVKKLFKPNTLALEYSPDVRSIALASVLKNIYSVALGIADGTSVGSNLKGVLVSRAINESRWVIRLLKGDEYVMMGTAGIGDMVATSFSPYSANREAGLSLARGEKSTFSEGAAALPSIISLLNGHIDELPLLKQLSLILSQKAKPESLVESIYG